MLTDITQTDQDIESYLNRIGKVFTAFRNQDSGCVSYGVEAEGMRWFVKHSREARGMESLRRAMQVNTAVHHAALPRLFNTFETPGGLALVYEWMEAEAVNSPAALRSDPTSAHARLRALPPARLLAILDTLYDVHLLLAAHGFVAVDFYDGSILYNYDHARTYLCDLDEYRPGPFVLDAERLPGSTRFMAPEEFVRGATIDQTTNVFTLGRAAIELLGNGSVSAETWKGTSAMRDLILQATAPDRAQRQPSVRAFVEAWRSAVTKNNSVTGGPQTK